MRSVLPQNQRSLRYLIFSQAGLFAANGLTIPLMANHYATLNADATIVGLIFAVQQFGSLAAPICGGCVRMPSVSAVQSSFGR